MDMVWYGIYIYICTICDTQNMYIIVWICSVVRLLWICLNGYGMVYIYVLFVIDKTCILFFGFVVL
jgi:hypothetical protein